MNQRRVTETRIVHTADLDETTREAIRALLWDVFDDMTEHDWEHCHGGTHAIALDHDGTVVGHAALVMRRLLHGERALRTGYVEGVAVRAGRRRTGIGAAVRAPLERMIERAFDVGALGATDEAARFYESRGWRAWPGRLSALTPRGIVETPDERGAVYLFAPRVTLDTDIELSCDFREGDCW